MKGYKFYLEYPMDECPQKYTRKEPGRHAGNVIATYGEVFFSTHADGQQYPVVECIGAVLFQANSPVCGSTASLEYLARYCKRISEAQAREIHPELFNYLKS